MATEIIELVFLPFSPEWNYFFSSRISNCSIHNYIFAWEMMSKAIHFNLLFTEKFLFPFCCSRENLWLHKFVFNSPLDIIQFIHLFAIFFLLLFLFIYTTRFFMIFSQPLIQMIDNFFAWLEFLIEKTAIYRNVLFQSSSLFI